VYLHFNEDAHNPTISILFHNITLATWHYELVFSHLNTYNCSENIQTHLQITYYNLEKNWHIVPNAFDTIGLCRELAFASTCGEGMFVSIAFMLPKQFDLVAL
jgi:hypothetical protein